MPLPAALDQKVRGRFDELIAEANELIPKMKEYGAAYDRRQANSMVIGPTQYGHVSEFQAVVVKIISLINTVLGNSDRGQALVEEIKDRISQYRTPSDLQYMIGTLRGLKDDYENGLLDNLEERIVAHISSDYMAQVDEILVSGQSDKYDHIFAAVICGVNLENALRQLCLRQSSPIEIEKPNGRPKRLGDLIPALQKANVYNALKADQLRAWAKVRNHAAHGEFEEFNRTDVEDMVKGVRNFLADFL